MLFFCWILYPIRVIFLSGIKDTLLEIIVRNFKTKKKKIKRNGHKHSSDFFINSILINTNIRKIKETKPENEENEKDLEEEFGDEKADDRETVVYGGYGSVN